MMFKNIFNNIEKIICNWLLAIMLIILTSQVVLRYIFHNPLSWSEELSRYLFVWFVFMGMSYAVLENAHIKVESLLDIFPNCLKKYIINLGIALWIILNFIIAGVGMEFCHKLFLSGQTSQGAHIKMWCVYAAIPTGFTLASLRLIKQLLKKQEQID